MPEAGSPGLRWVTTSSDIKAIRKSGRLCRGGHVFLWTAHGSGDLADVAVVTGRGFGNAVSRNAAKRRMKGGLLDSRVLLDPGKRYLLEGRAGVDKVNYQILVREIENLLSESRNWNKKRSGTGGE
jgi:ribonuclease P protein component